MNRKINRVKLKAYIRDIITKAKKDKEVLAIALFGSYARGEYYRDVDVCLFLNEKINSKNIFDKRLDYLRGLPDYFDVQIFQDLPLYIKVRILKEGKIMVCKDEDELYETAFSIIKEFNLFEKGYHIYLESIYEK